jgi:CBS domain-containing protein
MPHERAVRHCSTWAERSSLVFKSETQQLTNVNMRDVMVRAPALVRDSEPLREVARRLEHSPGDAVVVHFDDGSIAGLLTERDLVFAAQSEVEGFPGHAGWYANKRFVIAGEDESVEAVLHRLAANDFRRAVVVNRNGAPTGLFSMYIGLPRDMLADGHNRAHRPGDECACPC